MNKKANAQFVFTNPLHFLSFGFGSGLAPKAPGTFGTLAAIPIYWLIADLSLSHYLIVVAAFTLVGIYLCHYTAEALKVHDHPGIVWDEWVGYFITMTGFGTSWVHILIGFALFRLFDILKPWPIKVADKKLDSGLGIMLDDMIAGVFAWVALWGINYLWLV